MVIRKRILLWDWTNSSGPGNPGVPQEMNNVPFGGNSPVASVMNWNAWVPPELKGRAPFRPMVHGMSNTSGNDWGVIENTPYDTIMFFNEPERAGISPETARDIWYNKMLPLRHQKGKKLGSPAVAGDDNGKNWLAKFMSYVSKDAPDYLAIHWYSNDVASAQRYITDMHNKYPGHPVMVTEIACLDRNYNNVLKFTAEMCNWMDKQSWVFEYGFFDFQRSVADSFVSPAAQLMQSNGNFTALGNMYLHEQPFNIPGGAAHAVVHEAVVQADNPSKAPTPPIHFEASTPEEAQATTDAPAPAASSSSLLDTDVITHGIQHMNVNLSSDAAGALKVQNDGRKAKGLQPLQWDNTLAEHAEAWARHLVEIGQMVHSTGEQRPGEGENLAWAWSSGGITDPLTGGAKMW